MPVRQEAPDDVLCDFITQRAGSNLIEELLFQRNDIKNVKHYNEVRGQYCKICLLQALLE